jgi:hypothetical protein
MSLVLCSKSAVSFLYIAVVKGFYNIYHMSYDKFPWVSYELSWFDRGTGTTRGIQLIATQFAALPKWSRPNSKCSKHCFIADSAPVTKHIKIRISHWETEFIWYRLFDVANNKNVTQNSFYPKYLIWVAMNKLIINLQIAWNMILLKAVSAAENALTKTAPKTSSI